MSRRHSPYRRWLVILLLALLAPIMPGKMNLCLLPDGEMHLEAECFTDCGMVATSATAEAGPVDTLTRLADGHGGCLDFTVGESATRQQLHNASQSLAPGLSILLRPGDPFPVGQRSSIEPPPAPSPHLKSYQTTVLRI